MKRQAIITTYEAWLTRREYSPATIQKYTRALAHFFTDTGTDKRPDRETVAAWRDSLTAKGTPLPPSIRCSPPSATTKRASTTRPARPSPSRGSGAFSPTRAENSPALSISACSPPPAPPATSAPSCCSRRSARPASGYPSCNISRPRPSAAARRRSAARANAARSCCRPSSAIGCKSGAKNTASTPALYSCPA